MRTHLRALVIFGVFAAAAFTALVASSADARILLTSGFTCSEFGPSSLPYRNCPISTGSHFEPSSTIYVEADIWVDPAKPSYAVQACRKTWNGTSEYCGPTTWGGTGVQILYPDSTIFREGSQFDYRHVRVFGTPTVYGVYVVNGQP